jgi:hypothetical protein
MELIRQYWKIVKNIGLGRAEKDREELTEEEQDIVDQKMAMLDAASRQLPTE